MEPTPPSISWKVFNKWAERMEDLHCITKAVKHAKFKCEDENKCVHPWNRIIQDSIRNKLKKEYSKCVSFKKDRGEL